MNDKTRREIDKVVEGTLKDAGLMEPPVKVGDLLQYLEVHGSSLPTGTWVREGVTSRPWANEKIKEEG